MKFTRFKLSAEQKRKLKKGLPIRVKPSQRAMEGEGVCLVVKPEKYNHIMKKFDKNKGLQFKLDADELEVNSSPEMIDDEEVADAIEGSGLMAGGGKRAKKGLPPRTAEQKKERKKRKRRKAKSADPFRQISRKTAEAGRAVEKAATDVGKELKGISKKVLGKRATRALLDMGYELKDVAKEVGEDLIKEVEKMGDEVLGEFLEEFKELAAEAKDVIRKIDKASKIIGRNITPDKWGNLLKEIPRFYRAELRDTVVGQMLRSALREGTKMAIESALKAMYSNPYTAPLAPAAEFAYQTFGEQAIEELVDVSGLGLKETLAAAHRALEAAYPDSHEMDAAIERGRQMAEEANLAIPHDRRRAERREAKMMAKEAKMMEREDKKGRGLYARGDGLRAGGGVALQKRETIPNFMLKQQKSLPMTKTGSGLYARGNGLRAGGMIGMGGGGHILGMEDPVMAGVPRPRAIVARTLLTRSI